MAFVAALALTAAETSAAAPLVIRADARIAGFAVKTDGTLGGAIRALGAPTSTRRTSDVTCLVRWRNLGIRIHFYNLGGENPCARRHGRFSHAVATGPRWVTGKGLAVGDSRARLRALYPSARYHSDRFYGSGWWLVVRRQQFGLGGAYPGLMAWTRARRVIALVVRYPAGGD